MAFLALMELTINTLLQDGRNNKTYVHVKMQMVVMAAPSINNQIFMYQKDHPPASKVRV
jgi:hypothetical protein